MFKPVLALLTVLLPTTALASWPEDVTLSGMRDHGGLRVVDTETLAADYKQLTAELGVAVANKPMAPAETLGSSGFDFSFANAFVFTSTSRSDGTPSPWERAHTSEDPGQYMMIPTLSARKGLPMSMEVGANLGWIALSNTGSFGGYGRISLLEGWKPAPDLTFQVGYSGYVGNKELEVGTLDLGATLGGTFAFGTFPGINSGQFSPYLNFQLLHVASTPLIDESLQTELGIGPLTKKDAQWVSQLAGGFQITNGTFVLRLVGTYAFTGGQGKETNGGRARRGVPQGLIGIGFNY